jgi:dipeptidyl aminopeptidase/acylaminoacyl peptidase
MPPRTVLRRSDGHLVAQVQSADISGLVRDGFIAPERFSALAADGKTRLYGTLLRPSNFDPQRSYPVIDYIYGAPQSVQADPGFLDNVFSNGFSQTISELGCIVVLVDGRGTPGRSKAFHDAQYGHMGTPNYLDDHVAVVQELGRRYPYLDLQRVGIYGSSSGGYATITALLAHPDFYKVGIADAGGGDGLATSMDAWGEIFNGPEVGSNYRDTDNTPRADRLKAKLFIIHGEMDTISPPTGTFRFVDSLIKANKDFDLLIVPNAGHTTLTASNATREVYHYALRRSWDFFVRNLLDQDPPPGYDLNAVAQAASASK